MQRGGGGGSRDGKRRGMGEKRGERERKGDRKVLCLSSFHREGRSVIKGAPEVQ